MFSTSRKRDACYLLCGLGENGFSSGNCGMHVTMKLPLLFSNGELVIQGAFYGLQSKVF